MSRARSPRLRLVVNGIAVALLLVPLAFFKYYGFLAVNVTNTFIALGLGSSLPLLQVVLPVGISFFTFMAIAYVVDVFRGTSRWRAGPTRSCTSRSSPTSSPARSCGRAS